MARREVDPEELRQLTEDFRALGAYRPELWARSQLAEGIEQYARFVFLRQAWTSVVAEDDTSWIEAHIQDSDLHPRGPGAGSGIALKRLLATGASREDLTELVRVMQWQVLHDIMYQLSDSGIVQYPSDDMPHVDWMLFEVTEDGEPLHPIGALHESVLDTDPTGREMCPKGVRRKG